MTALLELLTQVSPRLWITSVLPGLFIAYYLIWIIYTRTLHPLAKVPGPLWCSVSRTWLMYRMYAGDFETVSRKLHDKYGPLLRIAPDEVACNDPEAIPLIYSAYKPLEKTDWYLTFRPVGFKSRPDLYTSINENDHAVYRKIVGSVYSLSSILKSEDKQDECVQLLVKRLGGFADSGKAVDFGLWLEMYAYDIIGAVFAGKQFGFLEHSQDHGNYIQAIHDAMPLLSVVAMAPSYIRSVLMVSAMAIPSLLKAVLAVDGIRETSVRETQAAMARSEEATAMSHDIVSQLSTIVQTRGEKIDFTYKEVTSEMWTGVMAGADSTSIAMRAIFYYMMKHPEVMAKAHAEIDAAFRSGLLTSPVQYNHAINLPYLTAIIKESMRLFPSFQGLMSRYAPREGIKLAGTYIPEGYRIGMNPAVVHYNKDIFGSDSYEFKPNRWLESQDRTRDMQKVILTFGGGTRTCTGQYIGMTEIYKVVPEILRHFTIEMAHDQPWVTRNACFNFQGNIICKLKRRELDL